MYKDYYKSLMNKLNKDDYKPSMIIQWGNSKTKFMEINKDSIAALLEWLEENREFLEKYERIMLTRIAVSVYVMLMIIIIITALGRIFL
jgi:hypothetical protein